MHDTVKFEDKQGIEINVWTIDYLEQAERLKELPIQMITTNVLE
jgi:hypothetical protein